MFYLDDQIHDVNEYQILLDNNLPTVTDNKKITYYNVACVLDIEVSSFYIAEEKTACMYAWVIGVNGRCIIGRTWEQALTIFKEISDFYELNTERRMVFYVHNLSYEFQFIRKLFDWSKVFALEDRKVVDALSILGIEFKCSYLLSGYSLAKVGEHLLKYPVAKMVGDLDYSLIRHSQTPLKTKEMGYILNDGLVVMAFIQETIENDGNISLIPLTKTGYVRKYCRNACMKNKYKYAKYYNLMRKLTIDVDEYEQLKMAFSGGFTHANAFWSNSVINNVRSYDFTSSYPSVMVAEKYPMSKGRIVKIKSVDMFNDYLNKYCCLFEIKFTNIESTTHADHPISLSKCIEVEQPTIDNGRIVTAKSLSIMITEQDFIVFKKFYKWDKINVKHFRVYEKGYLPTDFVKSILKLYEDKTVLKDVDGKEVEYMRSKGQLNSCYGMIVTDPCRDEIIYDEDNWSDAKCDIADAICTYNKSKKRFLFYPWGIWVTAYARKNLFSGIYDCNSDYVYSDTDSIKIINADAHIDYIDRYNDLVKKKLLKAMHYHNLPESSVHPKTIKGVEKWLGIWDFDGDYKYFKTLGAKRYMTVKPNDDISFTVSGVNKHTAIPYLKKVYNNDNIKILDAFSDGLYIPPLATGKNCHTYIDYEQSGYITDYLGQRGYFHEMSSVHMEETDYSLSLADDYINYLMGLTDIRL